MSGKKISIRIEPKRLQSADCSVSQTSRSGFTKQTHLTFRRQKSEAIPANSRGNVRVACGSRNSLAEHFATTSGSRVLRKRRTRTTAITHRPKDRQTDFVRRDSVSSRRAHTRPFLQLRTRKKQVLWSYGPIAAATYTRMQRVLRDKTHKGGQDEKKWIISPATASRARRRTSSKTSGQQADKSREGHHIAVAWTSKTARS